MKLSTAAHGVQAGWFTGLPHAPQSHRGTALLLAT
jgi:hypothetical protein